MKGLKGLAVGLVAAVTVVIGIGTGLVATQVSAQDEAVSIGSATAAPGEEASVDLEALNIGAPGLGAWTIDITYDPDVITAVDCDPVDGAVCNEAFEDDTVRTSGATATGLVGDTELASITFECEAEGESALTISLNTFADATVGGPQDLDADIMNGSVTCAEPAATEEAPTATEEAPTATVEVTGISGTGTGDGSGGGSALGWLIAALAAAGLVAVVGFGALRLRARRA